MSENIRKLKLPYLAEYARSGRAKCKNCKETINFGELRIGEMVPATSFDGYLYKWHHVECFFSNYAPASTGDIEHFDSLKYEDQKMIEKRVHPARLDNNEDFSMERELQQQSDVFYGYIKKIQAMELSDVVELLKRNKQDLPKLSTFEKYERIAECMTFGTLQKCPECKDGQLVFRSNGYICCGHLNSYAGCMYETEDPPRKPFEIPKELKKYDFLADYNYAIRERIYSKVEAPTRGIDNIAKALEASAVTTKEIKEKLKRQPLSELNVVLEGSLQSKKMKKSVEKLRGKVRVASSEESLEKESQNILDAEKYDVPVVSENILEATTSGETSGVSIRSVSDINEDHTILNDIEENYGSLSLSDQTKSRPKSFNSAFDKSGNSSKSGGEKIQTVKMKDGLVVDPGSGLDHCSHVYKSKKYIFSVVLNNVDASANKNSYYKLQLLESDEAASDGKHEYWVFKSWGRIGTDRGDNMRMKFKKEEAVAEFKRVYLNKTGIEWSSRKGAEKVPGKYYPMDIITEVGQSSLPIRVEELISLIFDVKRMKNQMVEFKLDLNKLPLGKISKKQVKQAYVILNDVSKIIDSKKEKMEQLLYASNRFYSLIPHDFGNENVPVLNSEELIQQKLEMLDSLLEMQHAYKLVSDAKGNNHKLKQYYDKLQADIEVLDSESDEYKVIKKYVKNTQVEILSVYTLNLIDIFKVRRKGEMEKFKKGSHNRMLLWHGSRITNFAGILSQGLRIAPPEAPVNGYLLGKGIYFADMVSNSAQYCHVTRNNDVGLLLLCEVDLGDVHELERGDPKIELPEDKHSVKCLGQIYIDDSEYHELPDGVVVPCGKLVSSEVRKQLHYNEYVVYDVNQVNIRYLVKVQFKFDLDCITFAQFINV